MNLPQRLSANETAEPVTICREIDGIVEVRVNQLFPCDDPALWVPVKDGYVRFGKEAILVVTKEYRA